jgi:LysR family transcriptional activator of mexEF-oprN operon
MNEHYGRDLDLNLLRVFVVVAEAESVTAAASRLYLTQPAVSAALRRLTGTVGAPLFVRQGRGITLTSRGERLFGTVRPLLATLVDAALNPGAFDPKTSERTFRLGLSDASETWLLPALLRSFAKDAPLMRFISVPVQFRNVGSVLLSRQVDLAVTIADDLPGSIRRRALFSKGFVCVYDPRHLRVRKKLTEREYFEHEHVIVSYNGDLRGIVEDFTKKSRRVRCSVSSFANIGSVVEGTALLATVPIMVADEILKLRPRLRSTTLPLPLKGTALELLWSAADDDDPAGSFVRERIVKLSDRSWSTARTGA